MAEIKERARRAVELLREKLEELADELNAAFGRNPQPVLVPIPIRGRGNIYAGALLPRGAVRRYRY
jgi:hypothetical protein